MGSNVYLLFTLLLYSLGALQVVLHAQLAEEAGDFLLEDVVEAISAKLIRRHPHVFGDLSVSGSAEVLRNWDQIKAAERAGKEAGKRGSGGAEGRRSGGAEERIGRKG